MKILYIITGLGQGGAERVVCDLADSMSSIGHEVKIAYLTGEILTKPKSDRVEIIPVSLTGLKSFPSSYFFLSKLIRSYKPDIIHSHMIHANILSRLLRITTPINKLICTAHSNNEGQLIRMLAYRMTHKLADISTNVSRGAVIAFENKQAVPKGGMITVYNGIDLDKFVFKSDAKSQLLKELNLTSDYHILLAVGRFNESKDYPNLIHAIYKLKKNNFSKKIKLLIAGDGELRNEIENLIENLSLTNDIMLLGRRDDIPSLMSAADLFILPSKHEGFGLVIAEAMACECLVIATDCGGTSEVLNNKKFLIEPSCPNSLAKKISYALNLAPEEKLKTIEKNLLYVQDNFSLKKVFNQWIELYNES